MCCMFWRSYNESYFSVIQSQNLCHKAVWVMVTTKYLDLLVFQHVACFRALFRWMHVVTQLMRGVGFSFDFILDDSSSNCSQLQSLERRSMLLNNRPVLRPPAKKRVPCLPKLQTIFPEQSILSQTLLSSFEVICGQGRPPFEAA